MEIDYLTSGQAETALLAGKVWDPDSELLIYNIDTYVEEGLLRIQDICGDGFIPCFTAPGKQWSFVRLDDTGRAVEVREKREFQIIAHWGPITLKAAACMRNYIGHIIMEKTI